MGRSILVSWTTTSSDVVIGQVFLSAWGCLSELGVCYTIPLAILETTLGTSCIRPDPPDLLTKHLRPFLAADGG
jgi:hypothetical protein